ncbi:alpha/beta-hydrolase [Phellopilus nigrolimitatus]|nr:alpha/beta-hydrolase [Phellopilus nigrolimitatus]
MMFPTILGLLYIQLSAFVPLPAIARYAKYHGNFTEPYSVAFLGMPYAEPPVADLRFRKPVALNTTKLQENGGVIDATTYPDFCVQGSIGQGDAGGAGSENCSKVNVYTPANETSRSKLPALFYIHGGGYVSGNPSNFSFDHWINQSPNVVVVSTYYRLDSFGFLSHPIFSCDASFGDHNAGFQDQILALKWVHGNIAAFGGDPTMVTIDGQSAGGGSMQMHMIAYEGSERLFSRAIAQSVDREVMPTPEQQKPLFDFYAKQAGCDSLSSIDKTFVCLRNASVSALVRAQDAGSSINGSLYNKWRPVLDKVIIPDYPTKLLAEGSFAHVPVIACTHLQIRATSNETGGGNANLTANLHQGFPLLNANELSEFNKVYDPTQFSYSEEWFRTGTGEPALRCGVSSLGNSAWTYRYNQPNPTENEPGITEHAAENWMMFLGQDTGTKGSTVFTGLNSAQNAFSEELIAYWLSFVRSGDPNTFRLTRSPEWPDFSSGERIVLQQDPQNTTTISVIYVEEEDAGDARRCAFVASKDEHMQD